MTAYHLIPVLAGVLAGTIVHAGASAYVNRLKAPADPAAAPPAPRASLVPLAGWIIFLRHGAGPAGRAAGPLTELAGGLIGLAAVLATPADPVLTGLTALFGWLLLALAVIDLRSFLLPDALNAAVLALGAIWLLAFRPVDWPLHVAGAASGYILLRLVEFFYRHVRRAAGLGRGDAKLLGAIGLWVGLAGLPGVLLIASLGGLAGALIQSLILRRELTGSTAVAFGPWIALGGFSVWLVQLIR